MARLLGNVQATRHVGHHGLDLWSQGHYRIAHLGGIDRLGVEIPGQEEIVVVERFGQFFVENGWIIHILQAQGAARDLVRSEERRVGKECVSTCRSWWSLFC